MNTKEPVTLSGWYELEDGRFQHFHWSNGQLLAGEVAQKIPTDTGCCNDLEDDHRFDAIIEEMYEFNYGLMGFDNVRPVASNLLRNHRAEEALTYLLGAQDVLSHTYNDGGIMKTQEFIRSIRTKIKGIVRPKSD